MRVAHTVQPKTVRDEAEILNGRAEGAVVRALVDRLLWKNIPQWSSRILRYLKIHLSEVHFEGESDRQTMNGESEMQWWIE